MAARDERRCQALRPAAGRIASAIAGRIRCWSTPKPPETGARRRWVRRYTRMTTSCRSIAQKNDGSDAPTVPTAHAAARTTPRRENENAAPARTPIAIAATSAAPSRIALRLTAVQSASPSDNPWNGARPASSSPSVRSPSGAALMAKSVIHTTSSAVATSEARPHRKGRRPEEGTPLIHPPPRNGSGQSTDAVKGRRPFTNRASERSAMSSVCARPSSISSTTSCAGAGVCMNPCPENPAAM